MATEYYNSYLTGEQIEAALTKIADGTVERSAEEATRGAEAVQNLGVSAETLPLGSEASVVKQVDPVTGAVSLNFKLPAGPQGPAGANSAYVAAQAGGYTDTEENFNADLAAMEGFKAWLAAL